MTMYLVWNWITKSLIWAAITRENSNWIFKHCDVIEEITSLTLGGIGNGKQGYRVSWIFIKHHIVADWENWLACFSLLQIDLQVAQKVFIHATHLKSLLTNLTVTDIA